MGEDEKNQIAAQTFLERSAALKTKACLEKKCSDMQEDAKKINKALEEKTPTFMQHLHNPEFGEAANKLLNELERTNENIYQAEQSLKGMGHNW